eukprot:jgi/Undpi1/6412/HiC_scaffold_20.g08893.m1
MPTPPPSPAATVMIGRLKKLVGRKGFSNNPAAEISDVMKLFEGDVAGLQKDIASLQRYAEGKGRAGPPANSQRQKHYQFIVATLQKNAQEHTKAFRDALLLRAAVEKQQNDRQRIFSHSRGVTPAAQLDYPLFGGSSSSSNTNRYSTYNNDNYDNSVGGSSSNNTGLRSRPARRPVAPPSPPAPAPTLKAGRGGEGGNGRSPPPRASGKSDREDTVGGGGRDYRAKKEPPQSSQFPPPPPPPPWPRGGAQGGGGGIGGESAALATAAAGAAGVAVAGGDGGGGAGGRTGGGGGGGNAFRGMSPFGGDHGGGGGGGVTADRPGAEGGRDYRVGYGGGGRAGAGSVAMNGAGPAASLKSPTVGAGLRKRPRREDQADAEEESRRAAWQVQVQEDSKNRVEESHKVEKMIGELGHMFSRFSTMVAAQEEVVMHIEDDVEAAHAFAEEGQASLAKYYHTISGNRSMIVKVFVMLIFFIWVFLGFMR